MSLTSVCLVLAALCLMQVQAISWPQALGLQGGQPAARRAGPVQQATNSFEKPWFCHDNECPPFTVLKNASSTVSYQARQYESGQFVATNTSGLIFSAAVSTGFKRIYQYTDGKNDKSIKVPLTTPVFTQVRQSNSSFGKSNYTVAVWLPKEFQDDPPKPTADDVEIITIPGDKVVYVLEFGGYLVDDVTVDTHAKKLKQALLEDRIEFEEDRFVTATYDGATQLTHRHNELIYTGESASLYGTAAV